MKANTSKKPETDDVTVAVLQIRFKQSPDPGYFRKLGSDAKLNMAHVDLWIEVIAQDSVQLAVHKSKELRAKSAKSSSIPAGLLKQYFIDNGFYMDCGQDSADTTVYTLAEFALGTGLLKDIDACREYASRFFYGNPEAN